MIFRASFYYKKINSRKQSNKFGGLIFAKDKERSEELIRELIYDFPIQVEGCINIMGPMTEKTLQEIYEERPELCGIAPSKGCIIGEFSQRNTIQGYLK